VAEDSIAEGTGGDRHAFPRFPLAKFVKKLDAIGYRGNYSFDVYNDDYQQMPPETVVNRARRAAEWLVETVLRRALPVPNMERLQHTGRDRDALTAIKPLAEKSQKV
jgi:hypothetical protein